MIHIEIVTDEEPGDSLCTFNLPYCPPYAPEQEIYLSVSNKQPTHWDVEEVLGHYIIKSVAHGLTKEYNTSCNESAFITLYVVPKPKS